MEPAEAPEAGGRALWVTRALDVLTASGWPLTQVAGLAVGPSVFPSESGPHCVYRCPLRLWGPLFFFENRLFVFGCAGSLSAQAFPWLWRAGAAQRLRCPACSLQCLLWQCTGARGQAW